MSNRSIDESPVQKAILTQRQEVIVSLRFYSWKTSSVRATATNQKECMEVEAAETSLTEAEAQAPTELDDANEAEELVDDWIELEVEAR